MAWTSTKTFSSGAILTAADMNTYVSGNTDFLHDLPGARIKTVSASAQAITTATNTAVSFWDTAEFDTDTFWSGAASTKLTIPVAGRYEFCVQVQWDGNSTGRRELHVKKNGTGNYIASATIAGQASDQWQQCVGYAEFSASDYIEAEVYQNSGGNLNLELVGSFYWIKWAGGPS